MSSVTCTIDGWAEYILFHPIQAQKVLAELNAVIRSVLCQVPDGYLVRRVDKKSTFMLVFRNPQVCIVFH